MPAFLKHTVGSMEISESGIVVGEESCSKVYPLADCREAKDIEAFFRKIRRRGIEYDIFFSMSECYLIVHYAGRNLDEAHTWFDSLEQELMLKAWNANLRVDHYCKFLGRFFAEKLEIENCILQPDQWKNAALYGDMETDHGEIETGAGVYRIAAVRRFLTKPERGAVRSLQEQMESEAAYVSATPVTDQAVADFIRSEYMGLESVMPRLKRNNPVLHSILMQEEHAVKDGQNYVWGGVYFLLKAADEEEMEKKIEHFKTEGKRLGMLIEVMPLATLSSTAELKKTLAMFGLMGSRQKRYHSLLASEDMAGIIGQEQMSMEQESASYDIEEMRELFFKKEEEE